MYNAHYILCSKLQAVPLSKHSSVTRCPRKGVLPSKLTLFHTSAFVTGIEQEALELYRAECVWKIFRLQLLVSLSLSVSALSLPGLWWAGDCLAVSASKVPWSWRFCNAFTYTIAEQVSPAYWTPYFVLSLLWKHDLSCTCTDMDMICRACFQALLKPVSK